MKSFDYFRKVNQDIETSSSSGGIFSIIAAICGILLFVTEYREYRKVEYGTQMFIDHDHDHDFRVNLNITFHEAPCAIISIDAEDEMQQKSKHDIHTNITFQRLSSTGEYLEPLEIPPNYKNSEKEAQDVIQAIKANEQCQVAGSFEIGKTPGAFTFSFNKYGNLVSRIHRLNFEAYKKMDIDHTINSLYFGDLDFNYLRQPKMRKGGLSIFGRKMNILGIYGIDDEQIDPYRGLEFKDEPKLQYENHLSILPVELEKIGKYDLKQEIYQYNIYSGTLLKRDDDLPIAYYRYKMNPVNIKYSKVQKPFYHFTVQMLAIVGGIFALIGIVYKSAMNAVDFVKKMKSN